MEIGNGGRGVGPLMERSHELRASLSEEMHIRKLPAFRSPARILQVVILVEDHGAAETVAQLDQRLSPTGGRWTEGARYRTWTCDDLSVAWERHSEFMTLTFIAQGAADEWFSFPELRRVLDIVDAAPGKVIRATKVQFLGRDDGAPTLEGLTAHFSMDDLVSSDVVDRRARVWSDFRLHQDGFGRLLIADLGLERGEPAQLLQALQELGNYRKMALLGLPVAQAGASDLTRLEQRLAKLTRDIALGADNDDLLLEELLGLSAELAQSMAETRYRMSASLAYAQICSERIHWLQVRPIPGFRSLEDFTERRLLPAVRTCGAFSTRLDDLARQAAWTSALLRTRIDTRLSSQQRDLLASMDRRTDLQLRLQQMVEWLSIVAVAYYAVGLLAYALHASPPAVRRSSDVVLAVAVPLTLLCVGLGMHALGRRFRDGASRRAPPDH